MWEIAHLQTGKPPNRGANGKIVLEEGMGLVFVLIPGGKFWMGAQKDDEHGHNFDPEARNEESPVREVALSPYFISKYEMTQGQWERIAGHNPSYFGPSNYATICNRDGKGWNALHPVEQISWTECASLMERLGLSLPTEAQWEYACRAGTESVYWSGNAKELLFDVANVADTYAKTHGGGNWPVPYEAWDDGNTVHGEIGTYRANAFGLHDVPGSVWEWCRDQYLGYQASIHEGDGEREGTSAVGRAFRGGSFSDVATFARSAMRTGSTPEHKDNSLGVRPARAIAP